MPERSGSARLGDAAAFAVLALEALALGVVAVGYVVYALLDDEFSALGWSLAAMAGVLAAGMGAVSIGFLRRRRFALGGALTWQLMQASVGVWVFGQVPWLGLLLIGTALLVGVAVWRRYVDEGRAERAGDATEVADDDG